MIIIILVKPFTILILQRTQIMQQMSRMIFWIFQIQKVRNQMIVIKIVGSIIILLKILIIRKNLILMICIKSLFIQISNNNKIIMNVLILNNKNKFLIHTNHIQHQMIKYLIKKNKCFAMKKNNRKIHIFQNNQKIFQK